MSLENKIDSVIIIEKHKDIFEQDYQIFDSESDTLTNVDINMIYINSAKDTLFIKRLIKDLEYYKTIKKLFFFIGR